MDLKIDVEQVLRLKMKEKADKLPRFAVNYLKRIIHQDELNEILTVYHDKQGVDFMNSVIDYFKLKLNIINEQNLPSAADRYIFVSNHPLGGLDGICLTAVLGQHYNGRIRCVVNDLLLAIPNLRSVFIPVNKHGSQSRETAVETETVYESDNQILTFPAGLCSRRQRGKIKDLEWKKSFVQKAVEYKRNIVPIFFDGKNSNFFYRFANFRKAIGLKMNLEMFYLPNEMFKNKGQTFNIHIGKPFLWSSFDASRNPQEWAQWIKEQVYKLA